MTSSEQEQTERKPKRNDKYRCPKCGTTITMHVRTSVAPVCGNAKSHTSQIEMEKV